MKILSEDKRFKSLCQFNAEELAGFEDNLIIRYYDDDANKNFEPKEKVLLFGEELSEFYITVSGMYILSKGEPIIYRCASPDGNGFIYVIGECWGKEPSIMPMSELAQKLRESAVRVKKRKKTEWTAVFVVVALLLGAILFVQGKIEKDQGSDPVDTGDTITVEIQKDRGTEYTSIKELYDAVSNSVVSIEIYADGAAGHGTATGMIISEDGHLISCDHIYEGWTNPKFKVIVSDGTAYQAVFVAADKEADISILKIVEAPVTFQPVVFGDSDDLVSGEQCVILGFPGGNTVNPVVTSGLISAPKIEINGSTGYVNEYVQTDATANPGNSGGGLFNMSGQVVGIVTSKYTATNYENTTYSIGSTQIENVVNQLLKDGSVTRISLGITFQETSNVDVDGGIPYGCKLITVVEGGAMSGFVRPGQIIVECNGKELSRATSMYSILFGGELEGTRLSVKVYDPDTDSYFTVEFDAKTRESTNSYVTTPVVLEPPRKPDVESEVPAE